MARKLTVEREDSCRGYWFVSEGPDVLFAFDTEYDAKLYAEAEATKESLAQADATIKAQNETILNLEKKLGETLARVKALEEGIRAVQEADVMVMGSDEVWNRIYILYSLLEKEPR